MQNSILFCFALLIGVNSIMAQTTEDFFNTTSRVKTIAQKGLDNSDPALLLAAAKILRKNPDIRPLYIDTKKSIYDPYYLLSEAESLAKSKNQREKIRKETERVKAVDKDYRPMNTLGGAIRVPGATELFIASGAEEEISFRIVEKKEIAVRFKLGEDISIALKDKSTDSEKIIQKNIGRDKVKTLYFTALPHREYALVMRNDFQQAMDCDLAIMVKN